MNLTKLRENQIQLIEHMEKGGYSKTYIDKIKREINILLNYGKQYESYFDYYEKFIKPKININTQRHKINSLTVIMNFDLYNEFPNRNHYKNKLIDNSSSSTDSRFNLSSANLFSNFLKSVNLHLRIIFFILSKGYGTVCMVYFSTFITCAIFSRPSIPTGTTTKSKGFISSSSVR